MSHLRVPSYRLHKPSGKAVVTLDGRDLYLGPWNYQESKAEYDRLVSKWITNGRRLPVEDSGSALSIAELALGFLDHAANYYLNDGETTSEYNCFQDALRPLHVLYSHQDVTDFGPLALKTVRQNMIEKGWCRQ